MLPPIEPRGVTNFSTTVSEFLEAYWGHDPVAATHVGVHEYDHQLPDVSRGAMEEWGETIERFDERFEAFDDDDLTDAAILDRQWARGVLEKLRIDHEAGYWERSPRSHLDSLGNGLHDLLLGETISAPERFDAILARLQGTPDFLSTVEETIDPAGVPPLWFEDARIEAGNLLGFLQGEIREAAAEVQELEDDIVAASEDAAAAVESFIDFLDEIEERADGEFGVGRDRFDRLLQHYHMLEMDADDLHAFGRDWIEWYEREMAELAEEMSPGSDWVDVLESVKDDHPTAENLRQAYEDETMLSREHTLEHDLVTIPEGETISVEWMPSYMRDSYPIAKPWVSPAFAEGLDGKWYITPVDPDAPPEERESHLRDNSWAWIRGIAQHEMYPGHHQHYAILKQEGTRLRKQFTSPVYTEGWGLYTEELFYETGLLAEPPMRLMQLRNGLWRAVRIVVDTGLHTRGMSAAEAVDLLVDRARLERRWAESEVRRYTTRPTYPSSYRIGLSKIMDLREAYKAQQGSDYSRKAFHDELMSYSILPLGLVEAEMLDG